MVPLKLTVVKDRGGVVKMVLNRIQGERKGLEEIVNQGQTIQEAEAVPLQEAKRHNLQDTGEY